MSRQQKAFFEETEKATKLKEEEIIKKFENSFNNKIEEQKL